MAKRARKSREATTVVHFSEDEIDTSMVPSSRTAPSLDASSAGRAPPLMRAPIETKYTTRELIFGLLNDKVREQRNAIYDLAEFVYNAIHTPAPQQPGSRPVILRRMLAGTSGCGKTESVLWIKHLLGMDAGYEYESQYLYLDGAAYSDEVQAGSLMGASAGLIGYRDGSSLADRLNNALTHFRNDEARQLATMDPDSLLTKRAQQAYARKMAARTTEERNAAMPAYILLFIDELDKASIKFMESLTGLMSSGILPTPAGVTFTLPPVTRLLIITACNFGATGISGMTMRNRTVGLGHVEAGMSEKGLQPCHMERLGTVLIYYPLTGAALKKVLLEKLDEYLGQCEMALRIGLDRIDYAQDVKTYMIECVMHSVDTDRGLRNGMRRLFASLDTLFKTGLLVLNTLLESPTAPLPAGQNVVIDKHCFERAVDVPWSPILQHICDDIKNEEELALCAVSGKPIEALVMTMGDYTLSNLLTTTHQYDIGARCQYDTQNSALVLEQTQQRHTALKNDVKRASRAIRAATEDTAIHEILATVELSEDDDDEESGNVWHDDANPRRLKQARVIDVTDEEQPQQQQQSIALPAPAPLLFEPLPDNDDDDAPSNAIVPVERGVKAGRPKKQYTGFTWQCYQQHNTFYQCDTCLKIIISRRVQSHKCSAVRC